MIRGIWKELSLTLLESNRIHDLLTVGSLLRINLKHLDYHLPEIVRKCLGNFWKLTSYNFLIQTTHIGSLKWRFQCYHLIKYTAQRPNVTLEVIRFILPNFRACIVWRASLSIIKVSLINDFGYIHITKFNRKILI